jgi:light-regulated signal transduction histidine kinase (bacteriophytochrome)
MHVEVELREQYHALLLSYAKTCSEEALVAASELGKRAVIAGIPHEEVVELHEETLRRLAREHPELSIGTAAIMATEPLMELFMAYGLAFIKQLEDTRHANEALREEMRIRERAEADLACHAAELARSNQDLEQFAYFVSHDLQAPLRHISTFSELLLERHESDLSEDGQECLGFMASGARRMSRMIHDLLAYSRAGRAELVLEEVDLDEILQDVRADLQETLEETGGAISWGVLPRVRASRSLIAQVFANLVGNGLKFHGQAPPRVQIASIQSGAEWIFSVEDNGLGIREEYQERIFQAFQRLHGPDEIPGSGIGLNICQRVIERHGGRIWVKSRPGRGSIFRFTLPCPTPDPPPGGRA